MKQVYNINQDLKEFSSAKEHFIHLVNELQSEQTIEMEHGDVEQIISREGNEILRRLLQAHLDLRSAQEQKQKEMKGSNGDKLTHIRENCERSLMSLFGQVKVRRIGYNMRGKSSVFPMDAELNLPKDKYSHGLRQRVAQEVSKNSFDAAVESIKQTTGGKVPKRQIEEITTEISQDFVKFYENQPSNSFEESSDPLIMSEDAKGIVMRQESLREATRKAAEKKSTKRKARLNKGEKRNRKRMAMVGAVYSIERNYRTPEEIMGVEKSEEKARVKPRARARNKRVWASVERDHNVVTDEIFEEALSRDPEKRREWVMLIDGHNDQLKNIRSSMKRYNVAVLLILDFIHVLEYLWKAAYCFYKAGSDSAEEWVGYRALQILKGNASHVAGGMRRSATLRGLSIEKRKAVDKCADYLLKYKEMLKYEEYLAAGLPIATGVIEGTCRHLINDRMDITGARWGLEGAEAVLKLRSLQSSGDIDAYLDFYKVKSLQRNHEPQYIDPMIKDVA
ncbi:MAG TPA: ISKra4 family transposase [Thermodesulfobacteriota bacterium]